MDGGFVAGVDAAGPPAAESGVMLLILIVAGEVAFWVLLAAGLVARYVLRRRRLGAALLVATAGVDVVLFVAAIADLGRGVTANFTHGLAAAYVGFSVALGPAVVRWADERFAHRFAGGPPPRRPPRSGWPRARHEWREWGRGMLGWAVACGMLLGAVLWIDDPPRSRALVEWTAKLSLGMAVWLVFWPVWASVTAASDEARSAPGDGS